MDKPDARTGVLFDVDGTLVDTTYLHAVAWWQALRQYGHDVPMATVHRAIGMGSDKLLDHLLGTSRDRAHDEKMTDAHTAIYAVHWPALRPLPGAAELVRACAKGGLRVVLASSASERELRALRQALDADEAITTATSADDAQQSKPAPDIVAVALERAKLDADRAIFVGDSVWDVQACSQLGLACIGVECGGTSGAELRDAGAVEVYPDPRALLAAWDASLLARLSGPS
jgi:HAD superfamily hydrolase (TIGR01509 family)